MPRPDYLAELRNSWRALAGNDDAGGYRLIDVLSHPQLRVRAGRLGAEEAIVFAFGGGPRPVAEAPPTGQGFLLTIIDGPNAVGETWYSLCRRPNGDLDMFENVAIDVLNAVLEYKGIDSTLRVRTFLNRMRAWQDFMRKGQPVILSSEEEVGLFGELIALRALIDRGLTADAAVAAWMGPQDGIHDFVLGAGGIEVKTCSRHGRFVARIGELDQLDDSGVRPLYLMAVQLGQTDVGQSLPEKVQEVRDIIAGEVDAPLRFENCLLRLGYVDLHSTSYVRRFSALETRLYEVNDQFPRLYPGNVPSAVLRASYDLDIEAIPVEQVSLEHALSKLGVI